MTKGLSGSVTGASGEVVVQSFCASGIFLLMPGVAIANKRTLGRGRQIAHS
jgi:hypothetical protein